MSISQPSGKVRDGWMTIKEAGILWGISTRRAAILFANGKVEVLKNLVARKR